MSVFYNGRLLVTPAVESAVYDQGMATAFPGRANNILAIVGSSYGGKPKTPLYFDSPTTAARTLLGGDLQRALEYAFNPSAETGSPARVAVVRVDDAVQSTLMLQDGSSNNVIKLDSVNYGALTNGIKVTIEAGTTGKKVTVQWDDLYYSGDNIARTPFTVRYTGASATATVAVTATTLTLVAAATTTLTLANYRTIRELCDAIDAATGFSVVVTHPTLPVAGTLDGMTATSCKDTDLAVKADLQAVVDWFNTSASAIVTATRQSGALAVPANISNVYLASGSDGSAPTNDDWQDAFDALQGADVQWVVPLSVSDSIWAMADAHVQLMSTQGKSERRAFVGGDVVTGDLDTEITSLRAKAIALASDRTAIVFPPMLDYVNDVLTAIPAYFTAAKVAGGFAAMNVGNTMTNKVLTLQGIDPVVSKLVDTDSLIDAGILTVKQSRRGYVVAKAISTWRSNANYNRVEISTGWALDYVARTVREALETSIGRKASPITLHEAISITDSVLRELAKPEPVGQGVIVGEPAYRGISAEIQGDVLRVWFECSPVIPVNFVLVGIYAQAYSGQVTAVSNG